MNLRSVTMGAMMALMVACGGKAETQTGTSGGTPAPSAPAEAAKPAEPAAKPLELKATIDIGAAVMARDPDNTSWKGISIQAPEGAKVDPDGMMIVIDDRRSVGLGGEKDIAEKKQQAQSSSLQKFVKFIVDEPGAIFWEAEGNFLFVANVKLGEDKVKSCTNDGYGTFTKDDAQKLFDACRALKLAP
jgi:hypothetical protein